MNQPSASSGNIDSSLERTATRTALEVFAQAAPFPILRLCPDATIVWANEAAARVMRAEVRTLPGRGLWGLGVDGRSELQNLRKSVPRAPGGVRLTLPVGNGDSCHLLGSFAPIPSDDQSPDVLLVAVDVTLQRQTESLIEEIVRTTEGLVGLDFQRELVRRLAKAIGCRYLFVGETVGQRNELIRTVALCADGAIVPDIEYELRATPCEHVVGAAACYHHSGIQSEFPKDLLLQQMGIESYYGAPLFDAGGAPIGIVVALHDKPLPDESWIRTLFSVFAGRAGAELARIRTEEHRRHLEADLERARRLESFGTIAGGIAHDFNNLLTAIIGNATLVRLDLPDASEPAKAMDDLCRAAERGRTLVQEIYNFSECGAVQIKPVLLRPLVDEVVTEIRHVGGERIRIETCVAATITVMADADKLHQVIHNLALNAAQAMGQEGKITITVSQERVEAAAAGRLSQAPGVYQTIMIEDTGPGIPATELGQIFDPFFTTKKNSGGTGLGLALVQRAVSAHGGMVTVSTQIGQGTRFTVYLPARTTEGASRPGGTSS